MNHALSTTAVGLHYLAMIEGTSHPSIVDALGDIAPDLADLTISFAYGQVYSRPGLDLRQRQLVTVAALASMGGAEPQLKFHIAGALNAGGSPEEVVELMMHLAVYAGFPAALNGVFAAKAVFGEKGIVAGTTRVAPRTSRYDDGLASLREIDGAAGEHVIDSLRDIAPDLGRFVIEFGFGDIYTRPGLDLLSRELASVAVLAATGSATPQLKVHMHGLLNVGGTREQLVEVITQIAVYAGFPRAINAALAAKDVLAGRADTRHQEHQGRSVAR
ncbi:carboxymuconolactone decarboxylase family protein [Paraburkholderia sartisoli]|uniref:4-carboxymuconolactone decarboxylase n=1 Tax=Paraburkholderia sartisoli TaxID=83784 RepID=A0A1H4H5D8_9BURK|nr:carboxymuconolactone decarboxylase family protein [Paraburkholderia sartisoli]SEB17053.1 4-carboxymuconolactone decarboxylase [Paraburkholderia sartisoli]